MTVADEPARPVRQLRLVVEAEDYDEALRFYRDVLGLPEQLAFQGEGDARWRSSTPAARRSRSPTPHSAG
ncbi:hypothetical protein [Nocardioides pakistanensis]